MNFQHWRTEFIHLVSFFEHIEASYIGVEREFMLLRTASIFKISPAQCRRLFGSWIAENGSNGGEADA